MGHSTQTSDDRLGYFTEYADSSGDGGDAPPAPGVSDASDGADGTGTDADQDAGPDDTEIVIPQDLSSLNDDDLANLHSAAIAGFNALYGTDGSGLDEDALDALSVLTSGIEKVQSELDARAAKQAARTQDAQALAARVGVDLAAGSQESAETDSEADSDGDHGGTEELAAEPEEEPEPETAEQQLAAREIRVNLSGLRSRASAPPPPGPADRREPGEAPTTMRDIVKAAPEFAGFTAGQGLDWSDVGRGLDRRLSLFNRSQYESANRAGQHIRSQAPVFVIQKPFEEGMVLTTNDPIEIDTVLQRAMREDRLPGNSLVAAGGWCAPSDTVYTLCEVETRDGVFSLPEIGITRGGIKYTTGPNFNDIWANTGWHFTEADDQAGNYQPGPNPGDPNVAGSKPCYTVECPDFEEKRLEFDGVCINAGLLMQRGFPEVIARTTRGALVVHDFKMAANTLAQMVAGSDAVTMPGAQVGATAPILTAIDLQVEHYRTVGRTSRTGSLEGIFPLWVHGAIRSDLARRLGVDLLDVPNSRIDAWFAARGVAPQFVYGLPGQDPAGAAGAFTAWPAEVSFLLYSAGTWVRGTSDILTLDTIYDSVQLGTNDFTALFTEEGSLVAKMCNDSRYVTVPICADGATHGGVDIACDGTAAAA